MSKVVFDYNKCTGAGDCVDACPAQILEVSENKKWCKMIDDNVEDQEAVKKFHNEVENADAPVNIIIKNETSDCLGCRACEDACESSAIEILDE
jgi:ferredoxin